MTLWLVIFLCNRSRQRLQPLITQDSFYIEKKLLISYYFFLTQLKIPAIENFVNTSDNKF